MYSYFSPANPATKRLRAVTGDVSASKAEELARRLIMGIA